MKKILNILKAKKRQLIYLLSLLVFIGYFYYVDPDNGFRTMIITLQILVISFIGIIMIELLPDIILDPIFGNEKELVEKAKEDPRAAAIAVKAKSLRLLAYAIIVAGSIIAFMAT